MTRDSDPIGSLGSSELSEIGGQVQTLVIRKMGRVYLTRFSKRIEVQMVRNHLSNEFAGHLTYFLHGLEPREVAEFESVPDGIFQAIKLRFLPSIALRFCPVRYRSIPTVTYIYVLCPHLESDKQEIHYRWIAGHSTRANPAETERYRSEVARYSVENERYRSEASRYIVAALEAKQNDQD